VDRVRLDLTSPEARGFDLTEYQELGELAREGLEVVAGAPVERRAMLLEMAAFADFLQERVAVLQKEWTAHRDALRAAGELPGRDPPVETRMTMSSAPAITVAGLCKSFGEKVVLDGIDLTVAEGTIFALLGPNGADHDGADAVHPDPSRLRPDRRRRPRCGHRSGRGARRDRGHRPVLGGGRSADRRGEPAVDGAGQPYRRTR